MSRFDMPAPSMGPILDYASPRHRGPVRLPSQSHIEFQVDRGEVMVNEWLATKAWAGVAMTLAVLTLVMMPAVLVASTPLRTASDREAAVIPVALVVFVWLT